MFSEFIWTVGGLKAKQGKVLCITKCCWFLKPLLGWQVIWDPGHIPKGVLALCADLRPWHDRDGWPHWWDEDWPGEPLLQQTPSHLWLAESIWDVSYSSHRDSHGTLLVFWGCSPCTRKASQGPDLISQMCSMSAGLVWGNCSLHLRVLGAGEAKLI